MVRNFTYTLLGVVMFLMCTQTIAQPTVTNYSICQGLTVPAGQGLFASPGGTTTPTTLSGSLASTDGSYQRGSGNTQTVYNSGFTTVYYDTFVIVPPVSGTFSIPMLSSYDNYMTLYQGNTFNPLSPATNFLYGDDDSYGSAQALITWNFVAGQIYTLVATSYSGGTTGSYTIPLPWTNGIPVEWYTTAAGGTPIAFGSLLNPVGVPGSGITNTNTLGATTFYAGYQGQTARNPAVFTIDGSVTLTPYTVCQGQTIPTGQGLVGVGAGTVSWYATATGGTVLGTGSPFNPVGVAGSGIANTNTPGTTVFYAQSTTCRVPVNFTIEATPVTTGYNICQGSAVPAGQGLTCTNGGNTTPTSISATLSTSSPTYVRPSGNNATTYFSGSSVYYYSYTFVAPASGSFTIPLLTSYDNYITLYQTSFNPASPATNFLFGDDDSYGSLQGRIVWNFVAGQTYVIVCSSYGTGVTGALTLSLPFTPGPAVQWFTAPSGGTAIGTGTVFNPVGVAGSGIANTSTPGATTFYAAFSGNTCRTPAVFNINPASNLVINVSGSNSICQGDSTMIYVAPAAGGTYQWQLNGTNITGATNASYKAPATGTYTISVLGSSVCGFSNTAFSLTVNPLPTATASVSGAATVCEGDTVHLTANTGTGLSYQWQQNNFPLPGATNATFNATVVGSYRVVVTNSNSCSKTSAAVNADILPAPISAITASGPLSFCEGSGVALNSYSLTTGTLTYQWYKNNDTIPGAHGPSTVASVAGSYKIRLTNSTGCAGFSPAVTVTVNPLPVPPVYQSNDTLSTAFYAAYQWYRSAQPIPGATQQKYVITQTGVYNVAVTDANNCIGLSPSRFSIPTGVVNYTQPADIKVYPNPVQDAVHVTSPVRLRLQVNDMTGRMLIDSKTSSTDLNISALPAGTYLLLLHDEEGKLLKVEKLQKVQ